MLPLGASVYNGTVNTDLAANEGGVVREEREERGEMRLELGLHEWGFILGPRATRSSRFQPEDVIFPLFPGPDFESSEILAVSRVFVEARKTAQTHRKTLIFEKSADQRR